MKNKKLSIEDLKVKSFVTSVDETNAETIKGGLLSIGVHCTHYHNGCQGEDTKKKCPTEAVFCGHGGHGDPQPVPEDEWDEIIN
ncbi:MAG: pinensin family lanthipeptide [Cyclobacteriaceae bacterium]